MLGIPGEVGTLGAAGAAGEGGASEPVGGGGGDWASAGELAATLATTSAHQRKDVFMFPPSSI
jgi:hypothetical protein